MKHYKYTLDNPDISLPHPETSLRVRQWANRRDYPISFVIYDHEVSVVIDAPDTREHNKAVNALARIIDRIALRHNL
jgi:hypothetical protein